MMPAGLDGNPNPVRSEQRGEVLRRVADEVTRRRRALAPTIVAIDGVDGSGKSTFANELATTLEKDGLQTVRSTIDWFHRPRSERWARGRDSPLGFYLDSHNLAALQHRLLEPFRSEPGASYQVAAFDEPSDQPLTADSDTLIGCEVLIFDGIFVNRPELTSYWDLTVFLEGQERVNLERLGRVLEDCPDDRDKVVDHVLQWVARIERYRAGMRYYLDLVDPQAQVDFLIDNDDLARPLVLRGPDTAPAA